MFISQQLILINRIKNKANRFFNFVSLILLKTYLVYRISYVVYSEENRSQKIR